MVNVSIVTFLYTLYFCVLLKVNWEFPCLVKRSLFKVSFSLSVLGFVFLFFNTIISSSYSMFS